MTSPRQFHEFPFKNHPAVNAILHAGLFLAFLALL